VLTALLAAAIFGMALCHAADEKPPAGKSEGNVMDRAGKKASRGIEKTAKRTGDWIDRTGTRAGKAVERTVDKTGNWVKKKTE
jgi:hypothetical protein